MAPRSSFAAAGPTRPLPESAFGRPGRVPCGRSRLTSRRSRPSALTRGFPLRASCHPRRTVEPSGDNSGTERCMRSESLAVPPECGDAPGPRAARTLSAPSTSTPSTAQPPRVPARDHGDRHGPCSSPRDGSAPSPFSQSVVDILPFSRRLSLVSCRAYFVGASSVAGARCVCRRPGFARPLKLCPARIGPGRLRSSAPGKTGLRTRLPALSLLWTPDRAWRASKRRLRRNAKTQATS